MATEKQRRAFISYSRMNKEFATKLTKGLKSAGYPVWLDQLDIPTGSRWDDEVEKALRECSIFMVILTPASIASENVKDEIGYAIDHGKRILPVLLEDCDVPLRLRRFQYVDFTTRTFEEGFESVRALLGDLVAEVSVPVNAKTPVVEVAVESKLDPVSMAPTGKRPASTGLVIGIVAIVVLAVAAIGFGVLSRGRGNNNPTVENSATEPPGEQVNGFNVKIVRYPNGEFVQTDSESWTETTLDNTEFYFTEVNRDEWSVYLYDASRNYNVHLDLYQNQIYLDINDGNGEFLLVEIVSVE